MASDSLSSRSENEPRVGQAWRNGWGELFTIERVETLPAEQGYVVGRWDDGVPDDLRFETLLGGALELVEVPDA